MVKEFVLQWEKNKGDLEEYFRKTKQSDYDEYVDIFKKVLELCLTSYNWDIEDVKVIDDGDYQGTEIFIAHKNTYQPSVESYVYTNTYYGSCSGCDTLQSINCYSGGYPSEDQVKDYMVLALHLVQKMNWMSDE